jgi:hypothetical protein
MPTKERPITSRQREVALAVGRANPNWYRAAHPGQRVTLANLFRAGVLARRAWRGVDGDANAAYEYRLTEHVIELFKTKVAT